MASFFIGLALVLLLNLVLGLGRVLRGPTAADRMLAAQLFGTTGVAILLLLSEAMRLPALRNVALVFAMLAVLALVTFVKHAWVHAQPESDGRHEH